MITIQDIDDYHRQINPYKSNSTYSTMRYNIIRLQKITKKNIDDLIIDDFVDLKSVKILLEKYALNTQIQTLQGIKIFLKFKNADIDLIENYNNLVKEFSNKSKEISEKNEMTENEEKNWIDYEDLKLKFKTYYNDIFLKETEDMNIEDLNNYNTYNKFRNILLLSFFIEIPPTRIGNYMYMKVRTKKIRTGKSLFKEHNYLMDNLDGTYELVFNKYKTAKFIGQVNHIVKKDTILADIIHKYLVIRNNYINNKSKTELLLAKDKSPMSQTNITDTLKYISRKVIGKELSTNLFRHIFINHFLTNNYSIEEKKKVANFIGQTWSPNMMDIYARVKLPKEKENKLIVSFD